MQVGSSPASKPNSGKLTRLIMFSLLAGIAVGYACNVLAPTPAVAKQIADWFSIVTDIFLRLIKMIIAPLVFSTIVSGIASMSASGGSIGRITAKAMGWFISASLISLSLGMLFANLLEPGKGLSLALPSATAATNLQTSAINFKDFFTHVFPTSIVQAMSTNEVLQILVFSIFFGFALASLRNDFAKTITVCIEELVHIMLRITDYVMRFAPLGVFAAIAAVVTTQGIGVLLTYGKFIGSFYLGLASLWLVMGLVGFAVLGQPFFHLLKLLREPMLIGFSTASSEAAYPKSMEQLLKFGVKERVIGFVLPLGYSFNVDGSMMYQSFAALFIAQAYGIELSLSTQISMLLVLLITSKGIAGVPRASLVVVAATLPMFNLPAGGLLLILGIDQFLDMGRTMTNVIGNGLATAAVAKWEGEMVAVDPADEESMPGLTPA